MQEFSKTRIEYRVRYSCERRDLGYLEELMETTITNRRACKRCRGGIQADEASRLLVVRFHTNRAWARYPRQPLRARRPGNRAFPGAADATACHRLARMLVVDTSCAHLGGDAPSTSLIAATLPATSSFTAADGCSPNSTAASECTQSRDVVADIWPCRRRRHFGRSRRCDLPSA